MAVGAQGLDGVGKSEGEGVLAQFGEKTEEGF